MTRHASLLLIGLLSATLGVVPAGAQQPVEYCTGRTPRLPDEFEGRDASGLSLSDALNAMVNFELDINGVSSVIGRAILYAEPQHVPQLKAIVGAYVCEGGIESRALVALVYLNEPITYFIELLEQQINTGVDVVYPIVDALSVRPRATMLPEYERLRQRAIGRPASRFLWNGTQNGLPPFEAAVREDEADRLLPIAEQADFHAERTVVDYIAGGLYNAETGRFTVNELGDTFDSDHAYHIDRLRELARTHPTVAASAVDRWISAMALGQDRNAIPNIVVVRPSATTRAERISQDPTVQNLMAVSAFTRSALPALVPPLSQVPPIDLGADLRPGPVCVEPGLDGALIARFRYTLAGSVPVRIPPGTSNTLSSQQGQQPEAFYPGVDGPGQAWPLRINAGESVTWTLRGQSVTASASSRSCSAPPVPLCAGRPATVFVEAGRVVGGPLAGTPFAGRLVGTPGADVIVGTDNADAILGLAGDDTLCGGGGDDALDSGTGTDTADGGPGADGCDASDTATACEGAVPALTDVRPVLECVTQATPGGPLTAYFGVENKTTRAGRVAYSSNNRITPAAFDRSQPDLFGLPSVVAGRPGRSPFYPGHAFTVTFQPGQNVVWKLFTRTSTASAGSTRCPAP